jgi:hypothetical protein
VTARWGLCACSTVLMYRARDSTFHLATALHSWGKFMSLAFTCSSSLRHPSSLACLPWFWMLSLIALLCFYVCAHAWIRVSLCLPKCSIQLTAICWPYLWFTFKY